MILFSGVACRSQNSLVFVHVKILEGVPGWSEILAGVKLPGQLSFAFTAQDIWQRLMEIQLGDDLMWLSTLLPYLFPALPFAVTEEEISGQLKALCETGYCDPLHNGGFSPNDFLITLADALAPILSFGSCAIRQLDEEGSGFQLAFIVGAGTNLVLEMAPGVEQQNWLQITAVNGIELSKLLYRIGFPQEVQEEASFITDQPTIRRQGAGLPGVVSAGQGVKHQYCATCGAALRPGVRFCPKCGAQRHQKEAA